MLFGTWSKSHDSFHRRQWTLTTRRTATSLASFRNPHSQASEVQQCLSCIDSTLFIQGITSKVSKVLSSLLHGAAPGGNHNENEVQIKNYAPHGPEGQWSVGRLRAVQCRPPTLNPPVLELGNSEQGKYEEEKRKRKAKESESASGVL